MNHPDNSSERPHLTVEHPKKGDMEPQYFLDRGNNRITIYGGNFTFDFISLLSKRSPEWMYVPKIGIDDAYFLLIRDEMERLSKPNVLGDLLEWVRHGQIMGYRLIESIEIVDKRAVKSETRFRLPFSLPHGLHTKIMLI